jgi:hypothetical protein
MRYLTTAAIACLLASTGENAAAQHVVPQAVRMTAQPGQFEAREIVACRWMHAAGRLAG